jgi:hypothetical protein
VVVHNGEVPVEPASVQPSTFHVSALPSCTGCCRRVAPDHQDTVCHSRVLAGYGSVALPERLCLVLYQPWSCPDLCTAACCGLWQECTEHSVGMGQARWFSSSTVNQHVICITVTP